MSKRIRTSPLFWQCQCPDSFVHFTDDDTCSKCGCTDKTGQSASVDEILRSFPYIPIEDIPLRIKMGIVFHGSSTVHPLSDTGTCTAVEDAFFKIRRMIREHDYVVVDINASIPDRGNSIVSDTNANARIRKVLEVTVGKLDWIVNGGLKRTGKPERMGEVKSALRILRDVGQDALKLDGQLPKKKASQPSSISSPETKPHGR
jgi:hypothetical protein